MNQMHFNISLAKHTPLGFEGVDKITSAIDKFSLLKKGWKFGRGEVISGRTNRTTKTIYWICKTMGFNTFEVFANQDGSVSLVICSGEESLDIRVSENNFVLRYEIGIGSNYEVIYDDYEVSYAELLRVLSEFQFKWKKVSSSELSTLETIASTTNDLDTKTYSTLTKGEFLLF